MIHQSHPPILSRQALCRKQIMSMVVHETKTSGVKVNWLFIQSVRPLQIYLVLDHRNFDSSFAELTECLTCIQKWMDGAKLKLNPEKTEFIIIGDRQARESLIQKFPTQLLGNSISPTNTVKNLGVTFDSGNTFTSHITKVCHACYYHLKDLRRIRKFLSVETAALLANSMISSGLDY